MPCYYRHYCAMRNHQSNVKLMQIPHRYSGPAQLVVIKYIKSQLIDVDDQPTRINWQIKRHAPLIK